MHEKGDERNKRSEGNDAEGSVEHATLPFRENQTDHISTRLSEQIGMIFRIALEVV
jgi:hypothetical protein